MIALKSALEFFLKVTREKIRAKEHITYPHNLSDVQNILNKLYDDARQTSGSSWCET
jgi:hypothetical protein